MDILSLRYGKVLVLGAIAATSAFVVTILIVLVCVGCQRKGKRKNTQTSGKNHCMDKCMLRQSKLKSMSKSDTRLHEMHRLPCNANGAPRNRPASMDLLLLHNRSSTTDPCLVPYILTGPEAKDQEHTFVEDNGLYENVGLRKASPPVSHIDSTQSPESAEKKPEEKEGVEVGSKGPHKVEQREIVAEYASVRKVRKPEQRRNKEGSEEENTSEVSTSTIHKRIVEPFDRPNFPKDVVIMGNGEQYIWKPPEESDIHLSSGSSLENGQSHASTTEVSEMYSTICKTLKKKPQGSEQQNNDHTKLTVEAGLKESLSQPPWEPCYEDIGETTSKALDSDPAYTTINPQRKRERQGKGSNTLMSKKKACGQPQGPERAMAGENLYETIEDIKQATNTTSTTTIFTFNDGMEMYVTGL